MHLQYIIIIQYFNIIHVKFDNIPPTEKQIVGKNDYLFMYAEDPISVNQIKIVQMHVLNAESFFFYLLLAFGIGRWSC